MLRRRIDEVVATLFLRGPKYNSEGGVSGQKFKFFLVLNYLKIWNTVQELFTEFKKLLVLKNGDVANSARFAKCYQMYRISHIVENEENGVGPESITCTGRRGRANLSYMRKAR